MLYLYQGDVCVTPVGKTTKEFQSLEKRLTIRRKSNRLFVDTLKFIFFVYHKVDSLGNKNVYIKYPIKERKELVVEKYALFKGRESLSEVLEINEVAEFLDFYLSCIYTDNERIRDSVRKKVHYWRKMYNQEGNSPEDDKLYADSMMLAQKLYKEYESKIVLEETGDEDGIDGAPLYLFEIPESQKPMHIRLQYGDLS